MIFTTELRKKNNKFYFEKFPLAQKKTTLYNKFGYHYFNNLSLNKEFYKNNYQNIKVNYLFNKKYTLFNQKDFAFKDVKKYNKYLQFYLKENYYHPLEVKKIDEDLLYQKKFFNDEVFDLDEIQKRINYSFKKISNVKKKKLLNQIRPIETNYYKLYVKRKYSY